jgi:glycosyltransferase involved in cell wall biosynthesis
VRVLFSKPLTFKSERKLPDYFHLVATEAKLSFEFAKKYPLFLSETLVRVYLAAIIYWRSNEKDIIVTGRYGEMFSLLQGFLPYKRRRKLILLDIEWSKIHSSRIRYFLSKLIHRAIAKGANKVQVFCHAEADNYEKYYGLSRDKFVWVPYCTEIDDRLYEVKEENYIFSGGLQNRDYETLFKAVEGMRVPLYLAAPNDKVKMSNSHENIFLIGRVNKDEFFSKIARAKLVVLSLEPGLMRCPGVITYVSAMKLGKCVIVNEVNGSQSYIVNGITGIVVKEKDSYALRAAIEELLKNDLLRRNISQNAKEYATKEFGIKRYIQDLERIITDVN